MAARSTSQDAANSTGSSTVASEASPFHSRESCCTASHELLVAAPSNGSNPESSTAVILQGYRSCSDPNGEMSLRRRPNWHGAASGPAGRVLGMTSIDDLRASLDGALLQPGNDGYEASSATHYATGEPALVVVPASTADVVAAVRHATANGLRLSVKGGGHGTSGAST